MKRAMVQLAVAGLVLSALGFQFTRTSLSTSSNYVAPRITQAVDESQRVRLKGNTHPLARPQYDRGAAPADLPLNRMLLVLKRSPEQESALRQLLDEQQDKSSPNFHKWLRPDEFGQQFGPADQDIQTTKEWLQQHGFQIGKLARGRTTIEFSGNAAQVQEAFGTSIHKYAVKGKEHWANASDPQIPAALAPVVAGVASLHNFERKPRIERSPERFTVEYKTGSKPQITGPNGIHFLGPGDYAVIYNINPLYNASPAINGSGITIAVVGRSDINSTDIIDFRSLFGLSPGWNQTIWNGPDPGELGGDEEFEADLDNSWSAAIAPGANIDFVVSATTNTTDGVVLSELYVVDNDFADIMTESFGTCESFSGAALTEAEMVAEQAAAQGITFVASAGDSGAAGCDDPNSSFETGGLSVGVPASTPFTVAVGGTEFNEGSNVSKYWSSSTTAFVTALSYIPEDVWNESCSSNCPRGVPPNLFATGGGISSYPQPAWQSGVRGVPADGHRHVPDVALTAAIHTPYLVCAAGSCDQGFLYGVGGTSASAPSFAGIMALVDQKMGGRQGLANYVLYQQARAESFGSCNGSTGAVASTCVFNDVTVGNNGVPGETGYPTTSPYGSGVGFDMATGLGSVNVANLVKNWAKTTFNSTVTTLSPSSMTGTHGQPQTITISVTSPSGIVPSGNVSLISDIFAPLGTGAPTINLCASTNGCTLDVSGNLTTTTSLLPGGTNYHIKAHYAGNGSLQASESSLTLVNISSEPSTTNLTVAGGFNPSTQTPTPLPGTITYGTFVYLRADVAGASGIGIPTGLVNFPDNGSYTGVSYQLNTEGAAASPSGFYSYSPGPHSVTASYNGDASFQSSASTPPFVFNVTQATSSMALSYTGASRGATFNATVLTGSGGDSPMGTVSFSIDGNPVASGVGMTPVGAITNPVFYILYFGAAPVKTGAQGAAAWLDSGLPNGKHTLQATYTGDTNYTGSSASFAFNLQPDFTLTTDNNFIGIAAPGQTGEVMATVGGLDGFTGTVTFSCSGLPAESTCNFSPATVKGSGTSIMTVSTTAPKSSGLYRPRGLQLWASAGVGIAGVFLLGVPARQRRWRRLLGMMLLFVAAAGCGGGSSSSPSIQHDPGTAAGTYNATLTASSGSLVHKIPFQLVIQ
jgi:hypothetical protein